jgi:hypothetical protein
MTLTSERLFAAAPCAQLALMASAIHELTIDSRAGYDSPDGRERMVAANEAVHALSGHLRDVAHAPTAMTHARAEGVLAALSALSPRAIKRLTDHNPL